MLVTVPGLKGSLEDKASLPSLISMQEGICMLMNHGYINLLPALPSIFGHTHPIRSDRTHHGLEIGLNVCPSSFAMIALFHYRPAYFSQNITVS
jgi:hypothetical protein